MSGENAYKITVVVPVYNKEKYIARCLESLRNQSLRDLEILCVDDGSSDASVERVKECMCRDSRIVLLENRENKGVSYTRNRALDHARGEYLFFLDADDYLDGLTLERYYEELHRTDADMCFFNFIIEKESGQRADCDEGIRGSYREVYGGQELMGLLASKDEFFLYACMVAYKREFVERYCLRFSKLKCGEGGEFILQALFLAQRVIVSEYRGYHYCLNDASVNAGANITEEALYGQVVQYIHMLQKAALEPEAIGVSTFLDWYRGKIGGAISNLSEEAVLRFAARMEDPFSRHAWSLLTHAGICCESLFSDVDMELLKQEQAVLIYGAGYETLDVLKLLNRLGIELLGIVVTDRQNNPSALYGHRIYGLESLKDYDTGTLVLITAHSKHQKTIADTLASYDFHRHIDIRRR